METLHIYTRVSTLIQATDGTSLNTQSELGIKRAKELGFDFKIWDEGGKSSDNDDITTRPVLNTLYNDIGNGNIKHIFVYDLSRISRNDYVASIFRIRCAKHEVTLYTKDGKYDFSNPTDKLLQQVLDAISQFDNKQRADRTRLGKVRRVKEGCWHGGPPTYGYRLQDKKLVIDETESTWVKRIFLLYNNGHSPAKIKLELESNGVLTRRGNKIWTIGSISALLRNTHYVGYYTVTDSTTNESVTVNCSKILDKTLWNSVQVKSKRATSRVLQQNRTTKFYLLRDIMYCGYCDKPIRGRIIEQNNERYYYCGYKEETWRKKGKSDELWKRGLGCGLSRSLNIPSTDKLVWDAVMKVHSESSLLREEFRKIIDAEKLETQEAIDKKKDELRNKSRSLTRDKTRLTKALAELDIKHFLKTINADLYRETKKRLEEELVRINDTLSQLAVNIKELANSNKVMSWYQKYFIDVKNKINLSDNDKKEYLQGLIDKIYVKYNAEAKAHELTLQFKHPIVNDVFEWIDKSNKKLGYNLREGTREIVLSTAKSDEKTDSCSDKKSKKKTIKQTVITRKAN